MNVRWLRAGFSGTLAGVIAFGISDGCQRHADIREERGELPLNPLPVLEAGPIPVVDSGLGTDAFPTCEGRPTGDCVGSNDFLCGFEKWLTATAENCQTTTGCKTNGWLEVKMAVDGCVSEIRMDKPNDDMIACLLEQFGAYRCPCGEIEGSHYFGNSNTGMCMMP